MNKTFDCIEMKRKGARQVQQMISGLSQEDELSFWRKKTKLLRNRKKKSEEAR